MDSSSKFELWADNFQKLGAEYSQIQTHNEHMIYRLFSDTGYDAKEVSFIKVRQLKIVIPADFEQKIINASAIPKIILQNQDLTFATLHFIYDEVMLNYYPQEPESFILKEGVAYQIKRDLSYENQIKQQLENLGFASDSSKQKLYFYHENENKQQCLDFWYQFKQNLDQLEQQGFVIQVDSSWGLDFADDTANCGGK